jgi:uracil-DNA glycosylase
MDRDQLLTEIGIDIWVRSDGSHSAPAAPVKLDSGAAKQSVLPKPAALQQQDDAQSEHNLNAMDSIEMLKDEVLVCQRCQLCETRFRSVPGFGDQNAKWFFVGEAPGAEEDRQGEPFVGRAGQLLDNIFRALGVARKDVYISNILKCHPPSNRDPKSKEIDNCRAFLYREIEIVKPEVVIALGGVAIRELLQNDMPLEKLRGKIHKLASTEIPCIVTHHPTSVLREPAQKRLVWEDLLLAKSVLTGASGHQVPKVMGR